MRRPRTGTEPVTARSPLRLRLILASAALVVFAAAAVGLAMGVRSPGPHDSSAPDLACRCTADHWAGARWPAEETESVTVNRTPPGSTEKSPHRLPEGKLQPHTTAWKP